MSLIVYDGEKVWTPLLCVQMLQFVGLYILNITKNRQYSYLYT